MTKEEIEAIIEKYRKRSQNVRFYGEEKCFFYEQVAEHIFETINTLVDNDDYESEEDIIDDVKETIDLQDGIFYDEDYVNMDFSR